MAIGYKKKNHIYKIKPFGRIKKEAYAARKTKNHLLHVAKKMWTVVVSLPGRNPRFGHRPLAACPWSRSGWKFREKKCKFKFDSDEKCANVQWKQYCKKMNSQT